MKPLCLLCVFFAALAPAGCGPEAPSAEPDGRFEPAPPERAWLICLDGPIDPQTVTHVREQLARASKADADKILLVLDSPGGRMDSVLEITDLLAEAPESVAYVPQRAYLAAGIIALGCDEVVLAPAGRIGRLEPIFIGPGGQVSEIPENVRGKIVSAIRSHVEQLCRQNGHSFLLADAMVTGEMEIYAAVNRQTRQVRAFCPQQPDMSMLPVVSIRDDRQDRMLRRDEKGWPVLREPWQIDRRLSGADAPLVLTASDAVMFGFARIEETPAAAAGPNTRLLGDVANGDHPAGLQQPDNL
ncbi:MAG: ATP-dependent Clp protease proteolytic subunit [Phycisphaerae bacterium]